MTGSLKAQNQAIVQPCLCVYVPGTVQRGVPRESSRHRLVLPASFWVSQGRAEVADLCSCRVVPAKLLTGTFVTLSALQIAFVLVEELSAVFAAQTQRLSLSSLVHMEHSELQRCFPRSEFPREGIPLLWFCFRPGFPGPAVCSDAQQQALGSVLLKGLL